MRKRTIKINTNQIVYLILFISIISISCFVINFLNDNSFKTWTIGFSIVMFINFVVEIIVLKGLKISCFSVVSLISLMSYLFQFGDTFMFAIGFKENILLLRIAYYTSVQAYVKASEIAAYCIFSFSLGGIIFRMRNGKERFKGRNKWKKQPLKEINKDFYLFLGYGLVILSLPLYIITFMHSINVIVLSGSYTVLAKEALPGYITSFGKFIYIGLWVLVLYYKLANKKKRMVVTSCIFLLLIGVNMMLGARSEPMTILFAFIIFYFKCIKPKITLKKVLFCGVAIYILADLMYAIQITRQSGFDISNILDTIFTGGLEVFFEEVFEFGTTILSTASVIERLPEHHPSWFLIKEILSIVPLHISSIYNTAASVRAGVPELGTSFIGEIYYYFGNYCYIACIGIALYISVIENWLNRKLKEDNYLWFLIMLMWMWQQLNCIRASYNMAIKTIVYSILLIGSLYIVYTQVYRRGIYKYKRIV